MAVAPVITIPVKADPAQVIAVIEAICRHLSALRDELLLIAPEWTDEQAAEVRERLASGGGGGASWTPPPGATVRVT